MPPRRRNPGPPRLGDAGPGVHGHLALAIVDEGSGGDLHNGQRLSGDGREVGLRLPMLTENQWILHAHEETGFVRIGDLAVEHPPQAHDAIDVTIAYGRHLHHLTVHELDTVILTEDTGLAHLPVLLDGKARSRYLYGISVVRAPVDVFYGRPHRQETATMKDQRSGRAPLKPIWEYGKLDPLQRAEMRVVFQCEPGQAQTVQERFERAGLDSSDS